MSHHGDKPPQTHEKHSNPIDIELRFNNKPQIIQTNIIQQIPNNPLFNLKLFFIVRFFHLCPSIFLKNALVLELINNCLPH
jgi:hypothetical protein